MDPRLQRYPDGFGVLPSLLVGAAVIALVFSPTFGAVPTGSVPLRSAAFGLVIGGSVLVGLRLTPDGHAAVGRPERRANR